MRIKEALYLILETKKIKSGVDQLATPLQNLYFYFSQNCPSFF